MVNQSMSAEEMRKIQKLIEDRDREIKEIRQKNELREMTKK
jgi:hypothetical protein